jgi:hypothetical protein
MRYLTIVTLIVMFAFTAVAQQADQPQPPTFAVMAGAGFNSSSGLRPSGVVTIAKSLTENNYVYNTTSFTDQYSTPSVGYARAVAKRDNFTLMLLADTGFATGQDSLSGAFGGGISVSYSFAKFNKVPGLFFNVSVKGVKTANGSGTAGYFQLGKSF